MGEKPVGVGHQLQAGAAMTRTLITYAALAFAGLLVGLAVAQVEREARRSVEIAQSCMVGWADAIDVAETCVGELERVQKADTGCACMAPALIEVNRAELR